MGLWTLTGTQLGPRPRNRLKAESADCNCRFCGLRFWGIGAQVVGIMCRCCPVLAINFAYWSELWQSPDPGILKEVNIKKGIDANRYRQAAFRTGR